MTKKEKAAKMVSQAWNELRKAHDEFGSEDAYTSWCRTRWSSMDNMYVALFGSQINIEISEDEK